MENSNIEWTDHTFNPWTGCTKVSPGCAHCYAESWAKRSGTVQWGPGKPRRRTKTWGDPVKWNREAEATQLDLTQRQKISDPRNEQPEIWKARRPRVFSASLADWLDDEVPIEWLADFLKLIHATPNLDWLLLTKRPQNWAPRIEAVLKWIEARPEWAAETNDAPWARVRNWLADWFVLGKPPSNIWIGTTVENQEMADLRIPQLLHIPAKIRFLSCEPLLGPVDLIAAACPPGIAMCAEFGNDPLRGIHWVIAGGESGPGASPMHPDWPRTLRDQCAAAAVPFLFKQWGEFKAEIRPGTAIELSSLGPGESVAWGDGATNHTLYTKIGKKAAGRHLDGQLHTAFPTP